MTDQAIAPGTITANGLEFGFLTVGSGPLALLLHGFPDSAWTWRHLMVDLAEAGYRAVAPFLRGYSPTAVPADGHYQPGAVAADANALHDALGGGDDAVLVGHDWGALASYSAAAHQPERWSRVVTAAVPPPATVAASFLTYDQLHRSWYMFFFQSPFADMVVPMDDMAFIDRLWADWSPGYDASEDLPRVKAALGGSGNLAAAISYSRATIGTGARSAAYDAIEAAGAGPIPQPTLYLHGADDGCMGADILASDQVLASLPHPESQMVVVEGTGHFLHLERPDEVNRLILDHLGRSR